MDKERLINSLEVEEGFRAVPYKDQFGNLTTGYGWNLDSTPLTKELARIILSYQVNQAYQELVVALPWVKDEPENIQQALTDMAFNTGISRLLKFTTFLSLIQSGNYSAASDDLTTTLYFKQVPNRVKRIQSLIKETE